jgi:hypothetical protein
LNLSVTFSDARIAHDNTCECCRIAIAFAARGRPVILFRNHPDVALAQMSHEHHQGRETCADLTFACAGTVTPAFAPDGALWVAARVNNQIFVAKSLDHGRSFSPPVVITPDAVTLDGDPDARPKIVVDRAGRVIVAYSTFRDKKFNGQLFYTRSIDGGKTFAAPQPITADAESQRFIAVAIDSDGSIFSAWLDKRNRAAAKEKGETYAGAGLAFAWSRDHAANERLKLSRIGRAYQNDRRGRKNSHEKRPPHEAFSRSSRR